MSQQFPRGHEFAEKQIVKKMIVSAHGWEIYRTFQNCYVLVVSADLYAVWIEKYNLQEDLFIQDRENNVWYLISSTDYIVSSLSHGPYPDQYAQIQAFSVALNQFRRVFTEVIFSDAIYIEEYSLLLPTELSNYDEIEILYSKWLTGGVNIPISQIDRIAELMTWLPKSEILKSASMAGFKIKDTSDEEKTDGKELSLRNEKNLYQDMALPTENFLLPGRPELERFINDNIIDIIKRSEQYRRMGISFPGATILYGPPGCGKTYAIDRLSEYLGWQRFDIDSSTVASPYIHDTSKKISKVFEKAIAAAPSLLVIDEMEAFLSERGLASSSGIHHVEEVAEFLRRIPDAVSKGVLIFAMTNMIDSIDPAVLRRGRFDHIIEINMPSAEEIYALLKVKIKELPFDETVDINPISDELAGHPMSDVSFVLREAGRIAVKTGSRFISMDCLKKAITLLPKEKKSNLIGFH